MPGGVRVQPEPRFVHALDIESGREQTYRRDYWSVDRSRFDSWLLELASRRASFRPGLQFRSATRDRDGWLVTLREADRERCIRCRRLVGADGATSAVRGFLCGNRQLPERLIALQVTLPPCPALTRQEVIFSDRLTDFYAWAIPKPGCVLVGSAFSDPHRARPAFAELTSTMCRRYGIENRPLARAGRALSRPRRAAELCAGDRGALLAGEAAGLVSPSSGEGISYALQSGRAAARALAAADPDRAYAAAFRAIARRVCAKLIKARIIRTPWTRRLALCLPWYP